MTYRGRLGLFFIIDTLIIFGAVLLSYLLRFDGGLPNQYISSFILSFFIFWASTYGLYLYTNLYKRVWQYASIGELIAIIRATTTSILLSFIIYYFLLKYWIPIIIPRSIFPLSWMTIILGIGGSRFVWRIYRDNYNKIQPHHKRALIVGAGNAGVLVVRELKHSGDSVLYPIAFIDDDEKKQNLEIQGLPVIGNRNDIPRVVESYDINTIIIAMPSARREEIAKVISICKETKANVKILPKVSDMINGKVSIKMIRDINVEDLLGREPIEVDLQEIAGYLKDKKILVTGAGGSIGSELCRQIANFEPKLLMLLGHGENSIYAIENEIKRKYPKLQYETIIADIQDKRRIKEVLENYRPAVVFHAAAHKHVPLMEKSPIEAIKNNVIGTLNVAEYSHKYGVERFVLISTDKAVNPTSVMGATKRIAEMIIQSLNHISQTKFVAVRFGNVLGSRGSVVPLFKQQIEEGGPVTVTHPDMVRYFMTIPEAVQLVIQAGAFAKGGEVFILDMGKPVRIVDLARDLIKLSGLEPNVDIRIEFTGIRPGEKLFEEILTSEEGTEVTKHHRIFVSKPTYIDWKQVMSIIGKFENIINNEGISNEYIKNLLAEVVPSYQYKTNYEKMKLDKQAYMEMAATKLE